MPIANCRLFPLPPSSDTIPTVNDDAPHRERWDALCLRVGAFMSVEESDLTFDMLRTLYAHPVRAYHNLRHIAQLLTVFDDVRNLAEDRDCVEFAIWMHDCVYFAERPDNEDRSADAAAMIAGLLGCTPDFTQHVRSLIAVTRHSIPPPRGDWSLIADVDLSILAAPWDGPGGYDEYRRAIRAEFAFATDAQYTDGRTAFINRMLDRDKLFYTAFFAKQMENPARRNLERELDELAHEG